MPSPILPARQTSIFFFFSKNLLRVRLGEATPELSPLPRVDYPNSGLFHTTAHAHDCMCHTAWWQLLTCQVALLTWILGMQCISYNMLTLKHFQDQGCTFYFPLKSQNMTIFQRQKKQMLPTQAPTTVDNDSSSSGLPRMLTIGTKLNRSQSPNSLYRHPTSVTELDLPWR